MQPTSEDLKPAHDLHLSTAGQLETGFHPWLNIRSARWLRFGSAPTITALLASIGLPLAELSNQRSKEEELRRSLREIRTALDAYKQLVDLGRIQRPADGSGYPQRLEMLVDGVADARSVQGTKIFLLRRLPRDPFAPMEVEDAALTWGLRSYASTANDPKPGSDVFDIYSMSTKVGMNGIPYRNW